MGRQAANDGSWPEQHTDDQPEIGMRSLWLLLPVAALLLTFTSCNWLSRFQLPDPPPEPWVLDSAFVLQRRAEIERYTPASATIPKNYFTASGFRDWYRWPLVYPYSINAVDSRDYGYLKNETGIPDIEVQPNDAPQVQTGEIIRFTFSKEAFAAQVLDGPHFETPDTSYLLLEFGSEKITTFPTKAALLKRAAQYGIPADARFLTLVEYDDLF